MTTEELEALPEGAVIADFSWGIPDVMVKDSDTGWGGRVWWPVRDNYPYRSRAISGRSWKLLEPVPF